MSSPALTFNSVIQPQPFGKLLNVFEKLFNNHESQDLIKNILNKLKNLEKSYLSLSPDDKNKFTNEMKDTIKYTFDQIKSKIITDTIYSKIYKNILPFIAFIILIFIFVLFGYKLYKSLMEKQRKRDEKSKAKKSKKNK